MHDDSVVSVVRFLHFFHIQFIKHNIWDGRNSGSFDRSPFSNLDFISISISILNQSFNNLKNISFSYENYPKIWKLSWIFCNF